MCFSVCSMVFSQTPVCVHSDVLGKRAHEFACGLDVGPRDRRAQCCDHTVHPEPLKWGCGRGWRGGDTGALSDSLGLG